MLTKKFARILDHWDMRTDWNRDVGRIGDMSILDHWDMPTDWNQRAEWDAVGYILDHWDMRTDWNRPHRFGGGALF